ncbi:bifunctional aminoglycoside phosphotransferase/ATP-binding protein [Actibacterium sp. MT2.3-13A]|uniref:bifunctional aminoglycoside phosphotransferase/ATP-binding protein n=1 Tax=Actibacterium sp. MT2.3-13A TaxID=2828332 RepID=UPI001BAC93BB|nr:bifunctional aminoglycoside phosphotransferase/ATP-binding protein [Actibacterium sp. MT2.3-13A]
MSPDDQSAVTAFLAAPETHGARGPVEIIETHISKVFLAGDRAYKLKRAVKLPYADFSTPEIRLATCHKEFDLNAPAAPGLYLGVRRITRAAGGGLEFDGPGALVDAVVEMVRFAQDALFDRMAAAGQLTSALMEDLAVTIAGFHARAPVRPGGGADNMSAVLDINAAGFATSDLFPPAEIAALDRACRVRLGRHAGELDRRAAQGLIRRCHGDLHLRNICLFEGKPRLFDCIDFSDQIATVDVLYDLAFLLMDLWHRDLGALANRVANRYFDEIGTDEGFGLLPFFMAVRASVRAHVTATFAQGAGARAAREAEAARRYYALALSLLGEVPPRIVAIGGLSGTGKTTAAEALAPALGAPPGARVVESDRTRKAMFGVKSDVALPQEAYRPEVSDRVYARLATRACALAGQGASVVVDAVFDRPDRRAALAAAVAGTGAPFAAFWLAADPDTLRRRVGARRGGPSDADLRVLEAQLARDTGEITWTAIPADGPPGAVVAALRQGAFAASGAGPILSGRGSPEGDR